LGPGSGTKVRCVAQVPHLGVPQSRVPQSRVPQRREYQGSESTRISKCERRKELVAEGATHHAEGATHHAEGATHHAEGATHHAEGARRCPGQDSEHDGSGSTKKGAVPFGRALLFRALPTRGPPWRKAVWVDHRSCDYSASARGTGRESVGDCFCTRFGRLKRQKRGPKRHAEGCQRRGSCPQGVAGLICCAPCES